MVALAADPETQRPWQTSALTLESGVLWEIGTGTPIPYRLVPTQLSWRSARWFGWDFSDGSTLVVRHRIALIGTWVQHGPESHYFGVSGSPSVEWWDKTGKWSLFTGSGGGFGWIDSRGVKGGQDTRLTAGIMYQHMSNGGRTKPNPGIDALGFTVGYSRGF